jgi:hypothetical protein
MLYTILIHETADDFARRTDPKRQAEYWASWPPYAQALRDAGVFAGGAGLDPPSSATLLRLREGRRLVQDGPYADTKEQLGGYFVIDVPDLETALRWAERCPTSATGTVELRAHLMPRTA